MEGSGPVNASSVVQVRPAVSEDASALADLVGQLGYPTTEDEMRARLALLEARDHVQALVAVADGAPVGLLTLEIRLLLHRPGPIGRVASLVVAQGWRGRSVGRALMAAAEAACAEAGCVAVEVTSNVSREGAHAFYERLGYARTSVRFAKMLGA
jgi:GNAT superfamily N-acetyltransferase